MMPRTSFGRASASSQPAAAADRRAALEQRLAKAKAELQQALEAAIAESRSAGRVVVVAGEVRTLLPAGRYTARAVVSATGSWALPYVPDLPGRARFRGRFDHSARGMDPNSVVLLQRRAVDYREGRDIKFRALDIANGGVDISFIKFRSQKVLDTGAVIKFTGVTGA